MRAEGAGVVCQSGGPELVVSRNFHRQSVASYFSRYSILERMRGFSVAD
jgi:hypothetical protein